MNFRFEPLRATQAIVKLVSLAGGRLNYTKALKLLCLADRQSLLETGSPITGDRVVNMEHGPVLSEVYNCIKGTGDSSSWDESLRTEEYDLVLLHDPGDGDRLMRYWQMIELVHKLPEWTNPWPARARRVSYDEILQAAVKSAELPSEMLQAYESLNVAGRSIDSMRIVRS